MATKRTRELGDSVAIIGAGIGGLAVAVALRRIGVSSVIYEQAPAFGRIGTAINMTPNAVKVLDGLGIGDALREKSYTPEFRVSRTWDTGEETSRVKLGSSALARYGVAPLMLHRADLMAVLEASVTSNTIKFGKKLKSLRNHDGKIRLLFEDKTTVDAVGVIGADGVHSVVRENLFGFEKPRFAGMSAYRTILPIDRIKGYDISNFVKWWGPIPESQIVTNAINKKKELFLFATMPETSLVHESWSMSGDVEKIKVYYSNYHEEIRAVINSITEIDRTALYDRKPLDRWSKGRVTLLGDACHAMMPFMAQGAAMGLEDAVILSRCVGSYPNWINALKHYEATRISRVSKIQHGSSSNQWLRKSENPDWVYGFDAWTEELC